MKCKRCGTEKIVKNGKKDKKQNYLCKGCGHQFISEYIVSCKPSNQFGYHHNTKSASRNVW